MELESRRNYLSPNDKEVGELSAEVKIFLWEGFETIKPFAYNVAEIKK